MCAFDGSGAYFVLSWITMSARLVCLFVVIVLTLLIGMLEICMLVLVDSCFVLVNDVWKW